VNTLNNTISDPQLKEEIQFQKETPPLPLSDGKKLYTSGWKASGGGWVADFGAAHTRPDYTGPEVDKYSFLANNNNNISNNRKSAEQQQQQQPLVEDTMLLNMARDVYSLPTDGRLNIRGLNIETDGRGGYERDSLRMTGLSRDEAEEEEEVSPRGFLSNLSSPTKSNYQNDFLSEGSSISLDPNQFGDLQYDPEDAEEMLMRRLQESVSLNRVSQHDG
jgi:hypothetical protein